jgi:hypothetical protein
MLTVVKSVRNTELERAAGHAPEQTELPFKVLVCAWCRPGESGDGQVPISHGICPRHFQQMLHGASASFSAVGQKAAVSLVRESHRLVQVELAPLAAVAA